MKALKPIAQSQTFHRVVSIMIVLCSITLGVETLYPEHKLSDKKLTRIEGDISETEREVETGFKEVLEELRALRREVEALKKS